MDRLFLVSSLAGFVGLVGLVGERSAFAQEKEITLDLGGATIEARLVPKGTFVQGSPPSEIGHDKDEEPTHPVTLTKDLYFAKTPVTRGQFARFIADTRYVTEAEKGQAGGSGWDGKAMVQKKEFTWKSVGFNQSDEHPVVLVTYGDALAFAAWAARKSGKRVRLPTEAEFEYAARAGTTSAWWAGNTDAEALLNGYFRPNALGTRPVAKKPANPFGLFDMSGNVSQWCRDVYAPYKDGPAVDPEVSTITGGEPERRVLRGGSWLRDPKKGRSASRFRAVPGSRVADQGFRIVIGLNDEGIGGGVGGGPGADFVPTAPVGANGTPVPLGAATASGGPATPASDAPAAGGASGSAAGLPSALPIVLPEGGLLGPDNRSTQVVEPTSWTLLVLSPIGSAAAVVAWMLLRKKKRPGVETSSSGITTRIVENGFFIRGHEMPSGTRVRYECRVDERLVSETARLEGSLETFVPTPRTPTSVRIVEVILVPAKPAPSSGRSPPPVPVRAAPSPAPPPVPSPAAPAAPAAEPSVIVAEAPKPVVQHATVRMAPYVPVDDPEGVNATVPLPALPADVSSTPALIEPFARAPSSVEIPVTLPISSSVIAPASTRSASLPEIPMLPHSDFEGPPSPPPIAIASDAAGPPSSAKPLDVPVAPPAPSSAKVLEGPPPVPPAPPSSSKVLEGPPPPPSVPAAPESARPLAPRPMLAAFADRASTSDRVVSAEWDLPQHKAEDEAAAAEAAATTKAEEGKAEEAKAEEPKPADAKVDEPAAAAKEPDLGSPRAY